MMFSKTCEYGIKASLYIAQRSLSGGRVSLTLIADAIDSPQAFTAKILQQLARAGIVDSHKGPHGGFQIAEERIKEIRLADIVYAIDGDAVFSGCALGLKECNADQPCPLHHGFVDIRDNLKVMLETTDLYELSDQLNDGLTFLKR